MVLGFFTPGQTITFLLYTGAVGAGTYFIVNKYFPSSGNAADDYFAGGRALKWYVVAGSLLLTNLSTEQFVGLNGAVFKDGCFVSVWWEAGASFAMLVTATVFLPHYLNLGLVTTAGYLSERYDRTLRALVACVFLVYYVTILCPVVLYTGSITIKEIFDLPVPLWTISTSVGLLGATYAVVGGLKAVAVADCLNGIGLLIVGLWIPLAALNLLPNGAADLFSDPAALKPLASECRAFDRTVPGGRGDWTAPSIPWHVPWVSLQLNNIYYFSTNQVIVQRALGAQSLADAQKGVMFAATMKAFGWAFLCLPGLVGILLMEKGVLVDGKPFTVDESDLILPALVKVVVPSSLQGFFLAVLLGSVLSTFSGAINSSSTMFGLEIYHPFVNPDATNEELVKLSSIFGVSLTVLTFFLAPLLEGTESIFEYLQQVNTIVSLPILTVFLVGLAWNKPDARAGKAGFAAGVVAIVIGQAYTDQMHYLHVFSIAFAIAAGTMVIVTILRDCKPYQPTMGLAQVPTEPWSLLWPMCAFVLVVLVLLFGSLQIASQELFIGYWVAWGILVGSLILSPTIAAGELKGPVELADPMAQAS